MQTMFDINPSYFGIHPWDIHQWWGIFTTVFVHGNAEHLFSNITALAGLLALLFLFYDKVAVLILIGSWIFTGVLMFFIARPGFFHIGASGVVYAISVFLFTAGVLSQNRSLKIISLIVAIYYGSMIWGLIPLDTKVSWDGHLSGAIAGVLLSLLYVKFYPSKKIKNQRHFMENEDDDEYGEFGN